MKTFVLIAAAMLAGCHPKPAHQKPYENTGDGQYLAIVPLGKCSCSPTEYNNHFHGVPCNNGHVETACIEGQCKNDTRCPAADDSVVPEAAIRREFDIAKDTEGCVSGLAVSKERHVWSSPQAFQIPPCGSFSLVVHKGPDGWYIRVPINRLEVSEIDDHYAKMGWIKFKHVNWVP